MTIRSTHIIGILSVVYLFVMSGLLFWILNEVARAGQELTTSVTTIAETNAKEKVHDELSLLVEETQSDREALTHFMLTEDETSSFLTDIERIGLSQGVIVTTNSLKVMKKSNTFDELIANFSLEGSEASVSRMLSIFESLPYQNTVTSLVFKREEGGNAKSTVELLISLLDHEG